MRRLRLIPDDTHIRFMWMRRYNFPVSVLLAVLSVVIFVVIGPQYGIDFRGGTLLELKPKTEATTIATIRATLDGLNLGDVQVQEVSDITAGTNILVRIQQQEGGDAAQQEALVKVREALGDSVEFRRIEVVGPRVSGELAYNGSLAMLLAMVGILIYVWFRFEWQFAVGAIICTAHDVLMTLGFFTVFQLEFNLSSLAALLTIVGYSLNDTVVVYDRIRENLRKFKKMPLAELIDRSINETLARTVTTSLTTVLALLALLIFGGSVIRSFVAAMIFGIVIGTYSSIFIAAPLLIYFKLRPAASSDEESETAEPAEA
ncbi:MAG: protein translocase subunit SecF [Bauldia sp.]|uniref:protein translocase subunit SecF n=1 Tax=Bauldia sp. TaxID=2575872 RepID=UPI001D3C6F98|nr:protein translocase subunit SecF [Bauldia sp.]MCB1495344.1 protein translocase subunit SecF [Bauldia sp.]